MLAGDASSFPAIRKAARAIASESSSVTEPTPGLMPTAVTQRTPSVGTPKANRRGCARPAASTSRGGLPVTASPPVSQPVSRYGPH